MKRWIHAARSSASYSSRDLKGFNDDQIKEIERGRESGIDVSIYADPEFDSNQMREIRMGLESGLDVSQYADPEFNSSQMWVIRFGLQSGLDVSWYADPKFDGSQMREIRLGLESGVDVSQYADPMFDGRQMEVIRLGLEHGLDISWYADTKFNYSQMEQIRLGLRSGIDVSQYADPKFDSSQMEQIRKALESGADVGSLMKDSNSSQNWPTNEEWQEGDLDELWVTYLSGIEAKVNEALEIEVEPSTQAGTGIVVIYDISEEGKGEQIASIDFDEWCERGVEMASSVRSANEYAEEYKAWIESNIL